MFSMSVLLLEDNDSVTPVGFVYKKLVDHLNCPMCVIPCSLLLLLLLLLLPLLLLLLLLLMLFLGCHTF